MLNAKMPAYDTMKDSSVAWLGEIPTGWEVKRLKYIVFINQQSLPESLGSDSRIEYVDIGNVSHGKGVEATELFLFKDAPSRARRIAKNGDTVISTVRTYLKAIDYIDETKSRYVYSSGFAILSPRTINSKFLTFLVSSNAFTNQVDDASIGVNYPAINSTKLSNLFVTYPSKAEQTAIAAFLDRKTALIDKAVAIKQKQIALLKERKQILIQNAVTQGLNPNAPMCDSGVEWIGEIPKHWDVKKSRDLFKFSKGLTITKENLQDEGIPCVNYGEIHSKYGFEVNPKKHPLKCVGQDYLKSNNKSLLNYGDFVFADTSEDLEGSGNFTYLNSKEAVFAGYHTVIARLIGGIKYRYVAYFLDSLAHRAQIRQRVKGVKVFSVTQSILKRTSVILPPFAEQATIITYLDTQSAKIDQAIALQQQQIGKLKEYKTTLINSAVTGKIKVVVQGAGERT